MVSPLFIIHGWATNNHIWPDLYPRAHTCYYDAPQFPDFNHLVQTFLQFHAVTGHRRTVLIGWSLGGMLALQLANHFPEHIAKVILISSTACFTVRENYPAGLSPAIVRRLSRKLSHGHRQALLDFYKLMFSPQELTTAQTFAATLAPLMDFPIPSLIAGLDYLLKTDLRASLPDIPVPCHIIHGSADEICPPAAGQYLADHLPHAVLHMLRAAGHIPFYTRFTEFQSILEECLGND